MSSARTALALIAAARALASQTLAAQAASLSASQHRAGTAKEAHLQDDLHPRQHASSHDDARSHANPASSNADGSDAALHTSPSRSSIASTSAQSAQAFNNAAASSSSASSLHQPPPPHPHPHPHPRPTQPWPSKALQAAAARDGLVANADLPSTSSSRNDESEHADRQLRVETVTQAPVSTPYTPFASDPNASLQNEASGAATLGIQASARDTSNQSMMQVEANPEPMLTNARRPSMPGTSTATHPLTVQEQKQGRQLVFDDYDATTAPRAIPLQAAKVPSSRFARALHYGGLGVGLAWGAAGSYLTGNSSRSTQGGGSGSDGTRQGSPILGEANLRRLVDKLSTMRGAALKLGQFLSIQDSNMLPPQLEEVLMRVQNSAHYMPQWQLERVMTAELGASWRSQFDKFDDVPFASASIGQVHAAVVATDHTSPLAGQRVAVKVQFPGVRASIASDLGNLRWLLAVSAVLPKGLFLDNTIRVMKRELDDECDYAREADMMRRFRSFIEHSDVFAVPRVVDELSTGQVLTTEMMRGRPLTQAGRYTQEKRNQIARSILELSLRELFEYRLMQTDPNWTNFLFNEATNKIELIDFGAARAYEKEFIDDWLCMLRAAIGGQRQACIEWSEKVGYLTGQESEAMRNAHVDSMIALGEPFRQDAPDPYPFAEQTITARVRAQIPLMLRERLTPPPEQTYSLNRKLSGAFLLCARLGAQVSCSNMFEEVTRDYMLGSASSTPLPSDTARRNGNVGGDQGQRLDLAGRRAFHSSAARHSPPESRYGPGFTFIDKLREREQRSRQSK